MHWISPILIVAVSWSIVGCMDPADSQDKLTPNLGETAEVRDLPEHISRLDPGITEHDLGLILSHEQTIRHQFNLRNPTPRPLRLKRAIATTPCCSEVEPLESRSIAPNAEFSVTVVFRPGTAFGVKRVGFVIETDSDEMRTIVLALSADLIREWEVEDVGEPLGSFLVGEAKTHRMRVVCRRQGEKGASLPESIGNKDGFLVEFRTPPSEATRSGDVKESSREFEIVLPGSNVLGARSVELTFRGARDRPRTHVLHWRVLPRIRIIPEGVVIHADVEQIHNFTIRASDRDFRVLEIRGAELSGSERLPSESKLTHAYRLKLDRSGTGTKDVEIITDHPHQRSVLASVMTLPAPALVAD